MTGIMLLLALVGAPGGEVGGAAAAEEAEEEEEAKLVPGTPAAVERAMKLTEKAQDHLDERSIARAIAAAVEAARLAPGAPAPRQLLGGVYLGIGDCAQSLRWLGEFARMGRVDKDIKQAEKLMNMCRTAKKRQGQAVVRVTPAEAAVNLYPPGGAESGPAVLSGQGTAEGKVPAGTYRLVATLPGHVSVEADVMVPAKGRKEVSHTLQRKPAVLVVTSVPPGAQIELDGKAVGAAPVTIEPVKAGDHEVVAKLDKHKNAAATVSGILGRRVEVELRPAPLPAKLTVKAVDADGETVEGANVEMGGAVVGKAGQVVDVPAGKAGKISVIAAGYMPNEKELTLTAGEISDLVLTLEPDAEAKARTARRRWGTVLASAGGLIAAAGVVALLSGMSASEDADAAYGRYQQALTGGEATSAFDEAKSLDSQAADRQTLGVTLLGTGTALGLWAGWQFLSSP